MQYSCLHKVDVTARKQYFGLAKMVLPGCVIQFVPFNGISPNFTAFRLLAVYIARCIDFSMM